MDSKTTEPRGNQWLLGIGIGKYVELPTLANAVRDVKDIIKVLIEDYGVCPSTTITLFDEEATRENIIHTLDQLAGKVDKDDSLLIYFAGHGYLNKITDMGYWIPHDAKRGKTSLYINNSTIRGYIKAIKSKHTLLIADSCFSGSFFVRGASRSSVALRELESIPSRWAICSGRRDQEVADGIRGGNSPFAQSILDALVGNTRQLLNVSRLADRVVEQTRSNYEQLPEGNPIQGVGHKGGQYIFHRKAREDKFWEECQQKDVPSGYSRYLREFPHGNYRDVALARIKELEDEAAWRKAKNLNTLSALLTYVNENPVGKFIEKANQKILLLEKQQQDTQAATNHIKADAARKTEEQRLANLKREKESKNENPPTVGFVNPIRKWQVVVFLVITIVAFVIWRSYDPVPDSVKRVIEQLEEYDSFSSNIATTEGAKEILDSVGLQDISSKEGEYATAPIDDQFKVTIWAQSHDKPNVFGVRYGTNEPTWDWEATYFEIVIPHDFVVKNCRPNLTLNQPEIAEMKVTINGVVLPSTGCPEIVRMGWSWGDTALRVNSWFPASHKYSKPGEYEVSVIAYDAEQNSATESVQITIREPKQVVDPTDSKPPFPDTYSEYYEPVVKVPPIYPQRALSRGIEGRCTVEFTVTGTGTVRDPTVVEDKCTSSIFHRSSIQAVLKFKYKPRVVQGKPIETHGLRYTFTYDLND